ncbi:hypothetical protein INT44_004589 [Umbelopsis vinacea]|uniref:Uncharacterized protein n=1 Tax=Umbelopsis vinacea TaxID=44442 RepID=A0A8H7QBH7_9FUNG|nr:hypothetical protein INT44_004589 [Umbelopsis vinacea]
MTSVDMTKLKGIPHLINAEPSIPSPRDESLADKPWEQLSKLLAPKIQSQANSKDKAKNVEQHIADDQ